MIVRKIKTTEVKVRVCDFCKEPRYDYGCIHVCNFCEKDVCASCGVRFDGDCNLNFPCFNGDHATYVLCKECWNTGEKYRVRIQKIRDEAEAEEESLWKGWEDFIKYN